MVKSTFFVFRAVYKSPVRFSSQFLHSLAPESMHITYFSFLYNSLHAWARAHIAPSAYLGLSIKDRMFRLKAYGSPLLRLSYRLPVPDSGACSTTPTNTLAGQDALEKIEWIVFATPLGLHNEGKITKIVSPGGISVHRVSMCRFRFFLYTEDVIL